LGCDIVGWPRPVGRESHHEHREHHKQREMNPDVKENVDVDKWDLAYQDVVGENMESSSGIYQHDLGQDEKYLNTGDVEKLKDSVAGKGWRRCARPDGQCAMHSPGAVKDRRGW